MSLEDCTASITMVVVAMVMVEMGLVVVVVVTVAMAMVVVTMDQMLPLIVDHVGIMPEMGSCPIVAMTSLLQ